MTAPDFLIPQDMSLAAAGRALVGSLDAHNGSWRETDRAFYDTFDGLLHRARLALDHEDGELVLRDLDLHGVIARQPAERPAKPFFAGELAPGRLRDAVGELVAIRALLPLVDLRTRERAFQVLDDERKTVVRLTIEQPVLASAPRGHNPLRPRVSVAGVRGYDRELRRAIEALDGELGFEQAHEPLLDEAVRAVGATPGGTSAKVRVKLDRDQRADSAAVAILSALLSVIRANVAGTVADLDSEFLHDLRTSIRRTRAVQRELRGVFPPDELARFRTEFRWLQRVTGESRDLDVYVLDFDGMRGLVSPAHRRELDPLFEVLRSRRLAARKRMVRALRSRRARALLADWEAFLDTLERRPEPHRADCSRAIGELAGERIATVYRRMVKMGDAIDPDSTSERYHELRKQGKELRYLLELFGSPLYPDKVVGPMVRALKSLQDVLGRHQDREVQIAMLRSLGDEVAATEAGSDALMAMGVLVERLEEDKVAARDAFAKRFEKFAAGGQRKAVRETFS